MDVDGCIWMWMDVGRMLRGLEENRRRIAGALEEPFRSLDRRSIAWVRPVRGLCADLMGKCTFFVDFFIRALKLAANH